jgi:hypothetical protein
MAKQCGKRGAGQQVGWAMGGTLPRERVIPVFVPEG